MLALFNNEDNHTYGGFMITFKNVTKIYDGVNVGLENASIDIDKGDFVFLVGPSGAGKSTFIKLILKEIDADSGTITVGDYEVTSLSNRMIPQLRRRVGMVFQDFRLLPKKTVFENVAFAMEILHMRRRTIKKRVPQVLELVGIGDKADRYPQELSAGEQQRVAIARAIINNPTVLIADEPTGNLDPETAYGIMELLEQIRAWICSQHTYTIRFGIRMLMDHFLEEAYDPAYPEMVAAVRSQEYYVRMMIAWYFATALAKQYDAVLPFIEDRKLDVWTHNKTIQKAVESYRITQEQKEYLRNLKI